MTLEKPIIFVCIDFRVRSPPRYMQTTLLSFHKFILLWLSKTVAAHFHTFCWLSRKLEWTMKQKRTCKNSFNDWWHSTLPEKFLQRKLMKLDLYTRLDTKPECFLNSNSESRLPFYWTRLCDFCCCSTESREIGQVLEPLKDLVFCIAHRPFNLTSTESTESSFVIYVLCSFPHKNLQVS